MQAAAARPRTLASPDKIGDGVSREVLSNPQTISTGLDIVEHGSIDDVHALASYEFPDAPFAHEDRVDFDDGRVDVDHGGSGSFENFPRSRQIVWRDDVQPRETLIS